MVGRQIMSERLAWQEKQAGVLVRQRGKVPETNLGAFTAATRHLLCKRFDGTAANASQDAFVFLSLTWAILRSPPVATVDTSLRS